MTAIHQKRLLAVVDMLMTLPDEEFFMNSWKNENCGCPIGHYASSDFGRADGFCMIEHKGRMVPAYNNRFEWGAICSYFGLDIFAAQYLFHPRKYSTQTRFAAMERIKKFAKDGACVNINVPAGEEYKLINTTHGCAA